MSRSPATAPWVVLLAGGIGSRFWPASTPNRPKQFLPLVSASPLIVDTFERARALTRPDRIIVVAGATLGARIRSHLPDLPDEQLLLEPEARGTAPALAWAAHAIRARAPDPDHAVMVSLHSDHLIRPRDRFLAALNAAVDGARDLDRLLTVGVRPSRPETGYGYIEVGEPLAPGVLDVKRFVEKPDRATAQSFLESDRFLWNSGIFVWRVSLFLSELSTHTPEIAELLDHLDSGDIAGFFRSAPSLSVDHGLLERTTRIAAVAAGFEWDDVGAWDALLRARDPDESGNVVIGDAHVFGSTQSVFWAEDGPIVALGLDRFVVARAAGVTFVAPLDRARDLKDLLARLPVGLRAPEPDE